MSNNATNTVYEGLLLRIFEQPDDEIDRGMVVAFTSVHGGAGVTQITRALSARLRESDDELAVAIDSQDLDLSATPVRTSLPRTVRLFTAGRRNAGNDGGGTGSSGHPDLVSSLEKLRERYRYVLIDCPALKNANDAVRLAPLVDGLVLVIEANRTQKQQILYAERTIENARGKILGHVLNKRNYVIPSWFYQQMETAGL